MKHRKATALGHLRARIRDVVHWMRGTEALERPSWEAGGVIAHHRRNIHQWIEPEDTDE